MMSWRCAVLSQMVSCFDRTPSANTARVSKIYERRKEEVVAVVVQERGGGEKGERRCDARCS